ncbi:alpha/beta fold hydrolase, partial [Kitasatospora sp. NPDC058263]
RRRGALATAVAALLAALSLPVTGAAAATGAPVPPVPSRYTQQRLAWQPCAEAPELECATMAVPRDWHHPKRGPDLSVAVSRHRADDPAKRRGTLLMAAGGPGGAGLLRPGSFVRAAPAVGAAYDVVGFDQRGVGRSTRPVCQTPEEFQDFFAGDFRDDDPAARARVIDNSRRLGADCGRRSGGLLPFLTTEQTVRDLDLFRALLGERRITYYGPSYATMIGAYYATLFPRRVDRMVLDSNVGFDGSWERFQLGQPMSFQRRFEEDFLPWLAARDDTYHYGATVAEAGAHWERRRAALHDGPLVDGALTVGPNQLDNGTVQAVYRASDGFPAPPAAAPSRSPSRHRLTRPSIRPNQRGYPLPPTVRPCAPTTAPSGRPAPAPGAVITRTRGIRPGPAVVAPGMSHTNPPRALHVVSTPPEGTPRAVELTQSWDSSAAERAADALDALRTVEVPVGAVRAALLILADLVRRPGESEEMRAAARDVCAVLVGLTDALTA